MQVFCPPNSVSFRLCFRLQCACYTQQFFEGHTQMTDRVRATTPAMFILTLAIGVLPLAALAATPDVTWMKVSTANSPSARSFAAMTYDPVSKKVVLFGG